MAADSRHFQHADPAERYLEQASADTANTSRSVGPLEANWWLPFPTHDLYRRMTDYTLAPQELHQCGYPRLCFEDFCRVVWKHGDEVYSERKTCGRCSASFVITDGGKYYASSTCIFHPSRQSATSFSCCGASLGQPGCKSSDYHVCKVGAGKEWHTTSLGFVRTSRRHGVACGVFALDCEMSFTIRGFEATRVSVVDWKGATVYDSYVTPGSPVLDYNTAFSGVTAEHLRNVRTTLQDVQETLLGLFNASTVLVGHGLENDFQALRLLHDTVVDTAVVFPHHRGLPFRRSLRSLVSTHLNRGVPGGPVGHDSVEDARACMELMLWRVSRDYVLQGGW